MKTFLSSLLIMCACTNVVHAAVPLSQTDKFIALCSGLELNTETAKSLAATSCMSRIVGFADGHKMTVELSKAKSKDQQTQAIEPLWCIPNDETDKFVLENVLVWINHNPASFDQLTQRYKGLGGAMAVVTKALHESFPCT